MNADTARTVLHSSGVHPLRTGVAMPVDPHGSGPVEPWAEEDAADDLMLRIRDGDPAALDQLMRLYWRLLVAYAMQLLGSRDAAEDIAQETFIRVWRQRGSWQRHGSVRAYLYRIAHNLALNEQRRSRVRARWLARETDRDGRHAGRSPADDAEEAELRRAAEEAIQGLPLRRREVYVLARFHALSYREIAQVMGVSPQTVANQMSAALADLRRALGRFLE